MRIWDRLMHLARRRSPRLCHLNSGSCNGCDIELLSCFSPRYDIEQLGVRVEGNPRHADVLCVTGPVTRNTVGAVKEAWSEICEPRAVVALGSCTASANVFAGSPTIAGPVSRHIPVDIYVPGCPPHPDAIIDGITRAAQILADRGVPAGLQPDRHAPAAEQGIQP